MTDRPTLKNGDFVVHRSPGSAPYLTIGRVIAGAGTSSHLRIHPAVRVFGFGSDHEHWAVADRSDPSEVVMASECTFVYEDNRGSAVSGDRRTRRPHKSQRLRGLYRKFSVSRTDGRSEPGEKHAGCEYFVLDLDHDPYAAVAIRAYAEACRKRFPVLSAELVAKAIALREK